MSEEDNCEKLGEMVDHGEGGLVAGVEQEDADDDVHVEEAVGDTAPGKRWLCSGV